LNREGGVVVKEYYGRPEKRKGEFTIWGRIEGGRKKKRLGPVNTGGTGST